MALIIDDIGHSYAAARQFLDLEIPITFSILPRLRSSFDLAHDIHDRGHEVMLHQPMEPYRQDLSPGPGALYVGDAPAKIARITEGNIAEVPFAIGVNNHMGSRFTANQQGIVDTLKVIKQHNLFFVDSRTSNRSLAYHAAKTLGVATGRRNVFLDDSRDESAILAQLRVLQAHAYTCGHSIGIGHPFPETARAIGKFLKHIDKVNLSLVHISEALSV